MAGMDRIQAEVDGLEGDGFCRFFGWFGGSLELTIDGYVGILVEAGIGLHTGFRLFAAFEDAEVVVEEA